MHGLVYIMLANIFWGFWGLAGKLATRQTDPLLVTVINGWITPVFCLVFWFTFLRGTPAGQLQGGSGAFLTIFAASACTFVATACYYLALGQLPAAYVVSLTAAYPLVTALVAWIWLGETLSLTQGFGILLIIGGAALLSSH